MSAALHSSDAVVAADVPHGGGYGMIAVLRAPMGDFGNLAGETLIRHDTPEKRVHQILTTVLHV